MYAHCLRAALCGAALALLASPSLAFKLEQTPGALSRSVVPQSYRVEIDADPYAERFSGRETIQFDVRKPVRDITLHANRLDVQVSDVDGQAGRYPLTADPDAQTVTIQLPRALVPGRHSLSLQWRGELDENGEGLYVSRYRTPDGTAKRMLVTQMEPIGARRMLPLFDEPAFRAKFDVTVNTPARFTVLGNMPVAAEKTLADGRKQVRFAATPRMASYLLAIAVGEFEALRDRHEGVDIAIWTTEGRTRDAGFALAATHQILDYYYAYFGTRYPLPKLDQIAVPGMRGAMENWGLITYGEELLVVDALKAGVRQKQNATTTIAHEIAHQWFGNLVTMAWWDDLWLNEAFAEWMGVKAALQLNPDWRARATLIHEREEAMDEDALITAKPIARPVTSDRAAFDSFDATTYNKGHMVIGLIEQYLGEDMLRDGLRDYLAQHAYSNATGAELWDALARRSGKPVKAFAEAWTRTPGHPVVFAERSCEAGKERITLRQARYGFGAAAGQAARWPVPLQLVGREHSARQRVDLLDAPVTVEADSCRSLRSIEPSPFDLWRLVWDDATQQRLLAQFPQLESEQRGRLLGDAWALAQTGQTPLAQVSAMIDALPVTDTPQAWGVATSVMRELRDLTLGSALTPQWDARILAWLAPVAERLAAMSPAERAAPAFATLESDVESLRGLAGDASVLALARKQFAMPEPSVSPDRYAGLLAVLGPRGNDEEFAALLARFRANQDGSLAWPYLRAVALAASPVRVRQVLALSLSDDAPRHLQGDIPGMVAASGHPREAWAFTRDNLDALFARSSDWGRRGIFTSPLRGARDTALAEEISLAARARLQPDELPSLEQAIAATARNAEAWSHLAGALADHLLPATDPAQHDMAAAPETH
ncbi:M1 family metallopeptidase [Niveibacterium umoris]|uniref:Aminopeptidase n=1 Tax=Niveibacterium umoris TaxID=1193620 RepID=A0A840BK67_9RHOO|nr:M1 family metallopeptidase [Niveibacterium umoris]MBB4013013.1 aminopeptidase N [Niveibacterium umoris]